MAVERVEAKRGQGFVSAGIVLSHDGLARGTNGCTEMVHHGCHKGTRQDATRNEGRQSYSDSGAQTQTPNCDPCGRLPPGVIWEIASQRGSNGGTKLPVKRGKQIMIQDVPWMRM